MLLISIPKPCHEKWSEMTPNEKGAFCKACSKTVVDFTGMSDEEAANYLVANSGQRTCGRFRNDQILTTDDPLSQLLARPIPFWKKFLAILLIVFSSFLGGCHKKTKGETAVPVKQEMVRVGMLSHGTQLPKEKPANLKTQCIEIKEYIVGDIEPPPPYESIQEIEMAILLIDKVDETILDENGNVKKKE